MTKICNGEVVDQLYWQDLSDVERKEFDYLDTDDDRQGAIFFRYRDWVYDLGEFMRFNRHDLPGRWDGYFTDSFFSAVVVRLLDDRLAVAMAYP